MLLHDRGGTHRRGVPFIVAINGANRLHFSAFWCCAEKFGKSTWEIQPAISAHFQHGWGRLFGNQRSLPPNPRVPYHKLPPSLSIKIRPRNRILVGEVTSSLPKAGGGEKHEALVIWLEWGPGLPSLSFTVGPFPKLTPYLSCGHLKTYARGDAHLPRTEEFQCLYCWQFLLFVCTCSESAVVWNKIANPQVVQRCALKYHCNWAWPIDPH